MGTVFKDCNAPASIARSLGALVLAIPHPLDPPFWCGGAAFALHVLSCKIALLFRTTLDMFKYFTSCPPPLLAMLLLRSAPTSES